MTHHSNRVQLAHRYEMKAKFLSALALSAVVFAGCSDKDVAGLNTNCTNLLGTFKATSATVTGTGTNTAAVNLIADSSSFDISFGALGPARSHVQSRTTW